MITILAGGQSNCSNTAGGQYTPISPNLWNLNIGDGKIYRAQEPLLGCDTAKPGASSNFLTRLGDNVLLAGLADHIVIAPFAISGVPAWLWGSNGRFHSKVKTAALRVRDSGLRSSRHICIWQHGETDGYIGTPGPEYTRDIVSVADAMQAVLGPIAFVLAQATAYQGLMSSEIRVAQAAVADPAAHRFVGPDTDAVDDSGRHPLDRTHWNSEGAAEVARLWSDALAPLLTGSPWM